MAALRAPSAPREHRAALPARREPTRRWIPARVVSIAVVTPAIRLPAPAPQAILLMGLRAPPIAIANRGSAVAMHLQDSPPASAAIAPAWPMGRIARGPMAPSRVVKAIARCMSRLKERTPFAPVVDRRLRLMRNRPVYRCTRGAPFRRSFWRSKLTGADDHGRSVLGMSATSTGMQMIVLHDSRLRYVANTPPNSWPL